MTPFVWCYYHYWYNAFNTKEGMILLLLIYYQFSQCLQTTVTLWYLILLRSTMTCSFEYQSNNNYNTFYCYVKGSLSFNNNIIIILLLSLCCADIKMSHSVLFVNLDYIDNKWVTTISYLVLIVKALYQ